MKDWLVILGLKKKPRDPNAPRYGDIYERSMAGMIDLTIIFFLFNRWVFHPVNNYFNAQIDMEKWSQLQSATTGVEALRILVESQALYWIAINTLVQATIIGALIVLVQIRFHTTPGKWLLGLKITKRGSNESPEPWRCALRMVVVIFAAAPLMIGIFWAAFNRERRGWHDMVAGTVVRNTRPEWWYFHQLKRGVLWVVARLRGKKTS